MVYELRLLIELSDRSHITIKVVMLREKSENSKEVIQLDFEVENKRSFTQKVAVILNCKTTYLLKFVHLKGVRAKCV